MLTKLDLKKTLKSLYNPSTKDFQIVDVPPMQFLMADGQGDPNSVPAYKEAVEALFSLSYALKFAVKKDQGVDYVVMPLEGLWWADDMTRFSVDKKGDWRWTVMIMQPECVTTDAVVKATAEVSRKKNLPALSKIRFETYHEGLSMQIMHIGPFSTEGPTLARMHNEVIPSHGYEMVGKHHEIYLTNIQQTAPEKWRTVLRNPIRVAEPVR